MDLLSDPNNYVKLYKPWSGTMSKNTRMLHRANIVEKDLDAPENNTVEKQVDAPQKKYVTATELTVAKHKQDQRKNSRVTAPKLCSPTKLGAALSNWSLSEDFFFH